MKLHLGCGKKTWPDWINIDADPSVNADVHSSLMALAYDPNSVEAVSAIHVLEHLDAVAVEMLCSRVHEWLQPGGLFTVEMPDREKCLKLAASNIAVAIDWNHPVIQGVGGLLGDRPDDHQDWVKWLWQNKLIIREMVANGEFTKFLPERFDVEYENHVYVWEEDEFCRSLASAGFGTIRSETPVFHGKRKERDMRIVAVK